MKLKPKTETRYVVERRYIAGEPWMRTGEYTERRKARAAVRLWSLDFLCEFRIVKITTTREVVR